MFSSPSDLGNGGEEETLEDEVSSGRSMKPV